MCHNSEDKKNSSKAMRIQVKPIHSIARALVLFLLIMLSACKVDLYTKVSEIDANDMLAVLMRSGINTEKKAEKKGENFTIRVEESEIPVAIAILKDHGFPRESFATVGELFKKEGLISSPLEERVRFIYSLSQNVQETLSRIDGVVTARVHIVLPENNPFSDEIKPSSASVFIKYLPATHLNEIKSEIKMIVERSIEGLSYEKVSLVMLPAKVSEQSQGVTQWGDLLGYRMPQSSAESLAKFVWVAIAVLIVLLASVVYLGMWIQRVKKAGTIESLNSSVLPGTLESRFRKNANLVSSGQ